MQDMFENYYEELKEKMKSGEIEFDPNELVDAYKEMIENDHEEEINSYEYANEGGFANLFEDSDELDEEEIEHYWDGDIESARREYKEHRNHVRIIENNLEKYKDVESLSNALESYDPDAPDFSDFDNFDDYDDDDEDYDDYDEFDEDYDGFDEDYDKFDDDNYFDDEEYY